MILMVAFPDLQSPEALAASPFGRFLACLREDESRRLESRTENEVDTCNNEGLMSEGKEADAETTREEEAANTENDTARIVRHFATPAGVRGRRRRGAFRSQGEAPSVSSVSPESSFKPRSSPHFSVDASPNASLDPSVGSSVNSSSLLLPRVLLSPANLTSVVSWVGTMGSRGRLSYSNEFGTFTDISACAESSGPSSTSCSLSSSSPSSPAPSSSSPFPSPSSSSSSPSSCVVGGSVYRRVDVWQAMSRSVLKSVSVLPPFAIVKVCGAFEASLVRDARLMGALAPRLLPEIDSLSLAALASLLSSLSTLGTPHPPLLSGLCRALSRRVFLEMPPRPPGAEAGGAARDARRKELQPFLDVLWRLIGALPDAREVYVQAIQHALAGEQLASPAPDDEAPKRKREKMRNVGRKAASQILSVFYLLLGRATIFVE
ncbi:hypothetical protein TGARI_359340 [Toxoplasma gondii ARI]|uniref:Uncharacterized protein n=1 Tax=Toxoplasma gondii ARI TaxID=1074872 RepID=A0A139Y9S1_TOXGO|nr:hypothetical protein TGARI_359340 [Toxoplasma gondii ARI]